MGDINFNNLPEMFFNQARQKYLYLNGEIIWPKSKYPININSNGCSISNWINNNYNTSWIRTETGGSIDQNKLPQITKKTVKAYNGTKFENIDLNFKYWTKTLDGDDEITSSTIFTKESTIYARYDNIGSRVITFDPNYPNSTKKTINTNEITGLVNSFPIVSRDSDDNYAYSFDGWYTAASGGSKIYTSTQFSQDTTVYAHWIEIEIEVPDENITIGRYMYLDGFNIINFHYIPPVMDVYYPSSYYRTSILDNIISLKASSYDENSGSWNMDQIISGYEVDSNIITLFISEDLKIYSYSGYLYDDFSSEHFVNAVQNSINDNFSLISLFHRQHPFSMQEVDHRTVCILFEDDIHPLLIDELLRCLNRVVYFEPVPPQRVNHWDYFNLPYLSYVEANNSDIAVTYLPQDNEIAINSSGNYTGANITNGTRFNDWYQALNILDNGDAEIIQPVSVLDVESSVIIDNMIHNSNYSDRTLIYPEINSIIMEFVPQTSNYGNAFLNSLIAKFAAVLLYSRYYDLYESGYLSNLYKGYSGEVDSYYDPNVEGGEYETIKQQLMSELLNHFSDIKTFLDEYHFVIINSDYFEISMYHEFITIFVTELSSLLREAFPDDCSLSGTSTETDIVAYIEERAFFDISSDNYGYLATSRSYDFFFKPLPKRNEYGYCYETIFSSLANSLNSSDNIRNILNPIHEGDYYIELFEEYTNNGDTLTTDVLNELETALLYAGVFFHITDVSNICLSTNSNLSDAFWYTNPNKFVEYNIQNIALRENI